ncbi:MAG TPA: M48 family metalloprotease [Xanthobacteraceae bacterium]|jgi:predicted Zn-dependent protease|nr:M48 family metalloprotease [Xanthobacteraceae bacterium]
MTFARFPSKTRSVKPASRAVAIATAAAIALTSIPASTPVFAQTGSNVGIPMIRDAEIEQLMRDYTAPILKVAGLAQQNVQVVIINDKSFNAFVMDAHRIFVNTGALMESTTPNQMIGVFAHETGHIVGGHLSKMRQELANAQTAMIIGMLLGVGAMVAGSRSSNTDMGNVGGAVFTAPQALAMNTLLSYQRAQEESADRAGVRFLTMSGQSAKGMYETFKRFADDSLFAAHGANPYAQNHPMPQERMDALAEMARTPYWDKKDSPELQFRHDMMRAKLYGFIERPLTVLRHYPSTDTSLPARYARAISAYRYGGDMRSAIALIDSLIQSMPNNPYFYELKGQALLENAHPAEAIAPLQRAVQLAPNPALIQILLSQALVATNDAKMSEESIPILRTALLKEPESTEAYTTLAMAYGRKNDLADADLASAQAAFARGDNKTARELAARAKQRFPIGSPGWVRADDIVAFNKNDKNPLFK